MRQDILPCIGFGGGCHWCTEAVFQQLKGIKTVRQGFIRSDPPHEEWSEAVEVEFDPKVMCLHDLISVHLATHSSTSAHKMRGKYRSAIYIFTAEQSVEAKGIMQELSQELDSAFVTMVLSHQGFKPSDERFQNYQSNDPSRPICKTYIDPKLAKLRMRFAGLLKNPDLH
ncbi:MAG: peptide-methionine (S)-S-oxide reductase [Pseudoruegeria sp.]